MDIDPRIEEHEIIITQINEEIELWTAAEMSVESIQSNNASIFELKCKVQAIVNVLINAGLVEEIDLLIESKKLILQDLQSIREQIAPKMAEAKRQALLHRLTDGIHMKMPPNPNDPNLS